MLLLLLLDAHPFHALLERLLGSAADLELPECYAGVLVVGRHLLPLLDLGNSCPPDRVLGIDNGCVARHVSNLNKGHWDQARPAEATDGLCDKPLGVRLGNHDNCLAGFGLQLVRALGLEVVHNNSVDHGARPAACLGSAVAGRRVVVVVVGCHCRGRVAVAGIVVGALCWSRPRSAHLWLRSAVALGSPKRLEIRDGDKTAGVWEGGIAGFVPVLVVFASDDMKEVAAGKAEFLWGCGIVVEEGSNDLVGGKITPCQHLGANASRRWGGEGRGHGGRGCQGHSALQFPRTFFGGTIATADLGAMLM